MKCLGEIYNSSTGPVYPVKISLEPGFTFREYREALIAAARQITEEALSKRPEEGGEHGTGKE